MWTAKIWLSLIIPIQKPRNVIRVILFKWSRGNVARHELLDFCRSIQQDYPKHCWQGAKGDIVVSIWAVDEIEGSRSIPSWSPRLSIKDVAVMGKSEYHFLGPLFGPTIIVFGLPAVCYALVYCSNELVRASDCTQLTAFSFHLDIAVNSMPNSNPYPAMLINKALQHSHLEAGSSSWFWSRSRSRFRFRLNIRFRFKIQILVLVSILVIIQVKEIWCCTRMTVFFIWMFGSSCAKLWCTGDWYQRKMWLLFESRVRGRFCVSEINASLCIAHQL